jgi:DNA-binding NarL/FixJ family response regulator
MKRSSKDTPAEREGKLNIAVVEDDERMRSLMAEWIKSVPGFCCAGVHGNGPDAVASLPAEKPDIVLMDINLPGFDGVECVRRLKDQMPGTQFVMLTVYEDSEHIFDALAAGAVGYLLKRSSPSELLEAINEVRAGGSPMTSIIARKVVQSFLRAAPVAADEVSQLSPREREVLELLAKGFFYKEIADKLSISLNTVHTYIRRIYEKLHVRSRMEAVAKLKPDMGQTR